MIPNMISQPMRDHRTCSHRQSDVRHHQHAGEVTPSTLTLLGFQVNLWRLECMGKQFQREFKERKGLLLTL
jgi:hypothetical protein